MAPMVAREEQTAASTSTYGETELAEKIEQISKRIPLAQQRISELRTERETLIVPARVDRDVSAQKRIRAIDEELVPLQHDLLDDQVAVKDLSERLEAAEKVRIVAEWEEKRDKVRKMLRACRDGSIVADVLKAAEKLRSLLRKAAAQDEESRLALDTLNAPRLQSRMQIRRAHEALETAAALELLDDLPFDKRAVVPYRALRTIELPEPTPLGVADGYRAIYDAALKELEDLELIF
jgi:hypothetical protein